MTKPKTARRAKAVPTEAPRQKRAARRQAAVPPLAGESLAPAAEAEGATATPADSETTPPAPKGPAGKLGIIVDLMRRPQGATVTQMGEATGWLPHSVRGAMAGSLKRKHKLTIVGELGEGGRVYRITSEQSA